MCERHLPLRRVRASVRPLMSWPHRGLCAVYVAAELHAQLVDRPVGQVLVSAVGKAPRGLPTLCPAQEQGRGCHSLAMTRAVDDPRLCLVARPTGSFIECMDDLDSRLAPQVAKRKCGLCGPRLLRTRSPPTSHDPRPVPALELQASCLSRWHHSPEQLPPTHPASAAPPQERPTRCISQKPALLPCSVGRLWHARSVLLVGPFC